MCDFGFSLLYSLTFCSDLRVVQPCAAVLLDAAAELRRIHRKKKRKLAVFPLRCRSLGRTTCSTWFSLAAQTHRADISNETCCLTGNKSPYLHECKTNMKLLWCFTEQMMTSAASCSMIGGWKCGCSS